MTTAIVRRRYVRVHDETIAALRTSRAKRIRDLAAAGVGPLSIAVRVGCDAALVRRVLRLPTEDA